MHIRNRDTIVASTIALGCGAVVGAFAFGPAKTITDYISQAAFYGWAGTIGTWVVGIGAFVLADAAHKLRVSELNNAATLADQGHDALVHSLSALVSAFQMPSIILKEMPDPADSRPIKDKEDVDGLNRRVRSAMATVTSIETLRVNFILKDADLKTVVRLQAMAAIFITACEEYVELREKGPVAASPAAKELFSQCQSSAARLSRKSSELNAALSTYLRIPVVVAMPTGKSGGTAGR